MRLVLHLAALLFTAASVQAQLQVELKFKRLQFIAHEPVVATVKITNLAGRDVTLRDQNGQSWFGFEVNARDGRLLVPLKSNAREPALQVKAGEIITRKINLTPLYPVQDLGAYHVRANVYFADLNRFYYSATKVFQVFDVRPIWQRTVGIPEGEAGAGEARTYSLLSGRFPDQTSLYVRVENKRSGLVRATYSLGRIMASGDPQTELDRENQLHVLHCVAPRRWAYSHIGLNGELLAHSIFMETKTRPRLRHASDGAVTVSGGRPALPVARPAGGSETRVSTRPASPPAND